jgi:hypothetical protein
MTLVWLVALLGVFLPLPAELQMAALSSLLREASPLLVLPAFALTYAVGWITNFCSERLLKIFFQRRIRDMRFGDQRRYEAARLLMLQHGSQELVRDVLIDRHIIRLARGGVMNFAFLAVVLSIYGFRGHSFAWPFAALSILLAALSFMQWLTRYRSHYARIERIADFLSKQPSNLRG